MAKGKKEEFLCLQCHQKVTENQHSVCCCICDRWIHKDCGLDDDEYKLIDKMFRKKGSHCWSCDGCCCCCCCSHGHSAQPRSSSSWFSSRRPRNLAASTGFSHKSLVVRLVGFCAQLKRWLVSWFGWLHFGQRSRVGSSRILAIKLFRSLLNPDL